MNARSVVICISATLLLGVAATGQAEKRDRLRPRGKTWTWNFSADTLGQAPAGARVHGGTWTVALDSSLATAATSMDAMTVTRSMP